MRGSFEVYLVEIVENYARLENVLISERNKEAVLTEISILLLWNARSPEEGPLYILSGEEYQRKVQVEAKQGRSKGSMMKKTRRLR